MARPKIELDAEQVYKLAALHCTNREIAAFFEVSTDTLERNYAAHLSKGRAEGKISLRRLQWQIAGKGNAALAIFLGKQYLDQSDQPAPPEPEDPKPSEDELV